MRVPPLLQSYQCAVCSGRYAACSARQTVYREPAKARSPADWDWPPWRSSRMAAVWWGLRTLCSTRWLVSASHAGRNVQRTQVVTAAAYRSSLSSCPSRVRMLCTTEDRSALLHLRPSTRQAGRGRGPGPGGPGCGAVGLGQPEAPLTGFLLHPGSVMQTRV